MKAIIYPVILGVALVFGSTSTAQPVVLCIGDSITEGSYVSVPYPRRIANSTGYTVINRGIGGQRAAEGLARIDDELNQYQPDCVLILFGANDIWSRSQDLRSSANAVLQMALRVRNFGAIPVIGTATPFINPREWYKPRVDTFNNYIRYYASAYGIALADLQKAFGTGYGLIISDGVHPNQTGSDIIARSFAARISLPPLILRPKTFSTPETGAQNLTVAATVSGSRTAVANVPWITITSGSSGSGNGTITFNVATNTGPARSGAITVAGGGVSRSVAINQDAATLAVSPSTVFAPQAGRTGLAVQVSAQQPWTAQSEFDWIKGVTPGGTGTGAVSFNIETNNGLVRAGTIRFTLGELTRFVHVYQWPTSAVATSTHLDFDGSGQAEPSVFYPASGYWYTLFSTDTWWSYQHGWHEVIPVPADYDGDGKQDAAVYFPGAGMWYIVQSSTGLRLDVQWGWNQAFPVPGDYDGDGRDDIAVFDQSLGNWFIRYSSVMNEPQAEQFGWFEVVPVPADYDGDSITDVAVYHPPSGMWYIRKSTDDRMEEMQWGWSDAVPVPGDYDGDGRADIAVFHRNLGNWYIQYSSITNDPVAEQYGWDAVVPVPADYDGDGKTDVAVYYQATDIGVFHPSEAWWYIRKSTDNTWIVWQWGWNDTLATHPHPSMHKWYKLP